MIGLREIDDGAWAGSVEQIGDEGAGWRAKEKKKLRKKEEKPERERKKIGNFFNERRERSVINFLFFYF